MSQELKLLPPEDLAVQLGNIETILSVYSSQAESADDDDDLVLLPDDESSIRTLAQFLALPLSQLGDQASAAIKHSLPPFITIGLRLKPLRGTLAHREEAIDTSILQARFALRKNLPDYPSWNRLTHPLWPSWRLHEDNLPQDKLENLDRLQKLAEQTAKEYEQNLRAHGEELNGDDGAGFLLALAEETSEAMLGGEH